MATRNINTFIQHLMNENLLAKKPKRDPYPTSSGVQSMAKDELTDYGSAVVDNARSRASDVGAAIKGAVRGDLKPAHTALINAVDAAVDAPGNVAARVGSAFKPDAKYGTTETRKGTTRAEVEQGMKDDERESGRRIGAFKHPKPVYTNENVLPGAVVSAVQAVKAKRDKQKKSYEQSVRAEKDMANDPFKMYPPPGDKYHGTKVKDLRRMGTVIDRLESEKAAGRGYDDYLNKVKEREAGRSS